jgi:cellulose synthase/poly-beta-1,6-N-acetylglucosamine synthase-like glycosyltransferase
MNSAILVAYKDPGFIEENIIRLKEWGFEIIIAADEPDERLLEIIEKHNLKATVCDKRRGKWKALNDAVKLVNGDYILFLDSDTRIIYPGDFEEFDVVEIRKEVNSSSIIEKLANIDYLIMFLTSKLASKLNSCLALNGSAFIIKRSVLNELGGFRALINEDTDIGMRAGLNGYSFGVCGMALTKSPSNLKSWFVQRERWSVGGAQVLMKNFSDIVKKPKLWLPCLFIFYPAIIGISVGLLLQDGLILKLMYVILPFLLFLPSKLLSFLLLAVFGLHLLKNLIVITVSFLLWALVLAIFSMKTKYRIEFRLLPVYYLIYSPLWTMLCIIALVRVLSYRIMRKEVKVKNWIV